MKSIKFLFLGIFLCILISSCKKEPIKSEIDPTPIVYDENYLTSVKAFTSLMDEISSGKILKSKQYIKVNEVADKIEASINLKYCFPEERISGSKTVDTIITIVPDSLDYLKLTNVESIYNSVKEIIIYQLRHSGFSNYKLILIAFEPILTANKFKLYTVIGNTNLESYPETDYWYGDLLGTCNNEYQFEIDAAEFIQNRLNDYFISLRPTPPQGCRYVYVGNYLVHPVKTLLDPTPDNYLDYDIFYASSYFNNPPSSSLDDIVKCLAFSDEIQFYESKYKNLIIANQSTLRTYSNCDVVGSWNTIQISDKKYLYIQHELYIYLSVPLKECDEMEWPINITDL